MGDVERLKERLSDLSILRDGLVEAHETLGDVVAATLPVELETDAAGHIALRNVAGEIGKVVDEILELGEDFYVKAAELGGKARL